MIRYSGENWQPYPPYVGGGGYASTLAMTDEERAKTKRRPVGFAPPEPKRPKPRIRPKVR